MTDQSLTWAIVDQVAADLGANEEARRKWRQTNRRVPAEWRLRIAEEMTRRGQPVSFDAFDRLATTPGRIAA